MQISLPSKVQTGAAVVGPAVVGPAVVGPAVVGPAVVGPAVEGPAVVGTEEGSEHFPELQLRPSAQGPTLLA